MIGARWRILLFIGLMGLSACSSRDPKGQQMMGDWILEEAVRQGRHTSTLDGLQFNFTKDSLYTNLPLFGNNTYHYAHDTLTIQSSDPIYFNVFHVDSTQLDLHGEIRHVNFRLKFEKITP